MTVMLWLKQTKYQIAIEEELQKRVEDLKKILRTFLAPYIYGCTDFVIKYEKSLQVGMRVWE